jgi:hypothetical protein
LSDVAKVDLAYVAIEGVRAVRALVETAIVPLQSHPDPVVGLVVGSLGLATEMMERYACAIDLASSNTAFKTSTGQAHQMLDLESCHHQKAEQLLVQSIGAVGVAGALHHALADTKATFNRLAPAHESVPQPSELRRRIEVIKQAVTVETSSYQLPTPTEGHRI